MDKKKAGASLVLAWVAVAACSRSESEGVRVGAHASAPIAVPAALERAWEHGGLSAHGVAIPSFSGVLGVAVSIATDDRSARITVPDRADGPLRVERSPTRWVAAQALDLAASHADVETDRVRFADVAPSVDLIHLAKAEGVEELRVLRAPSTTYRATYRVTLGADLVGLHVREGLVEAVDAGGRAWFRSPPPIAVDARGVQRRAAVSIERDGLAWRSTVLLDTRGLTAPIALDPGWFVTSAMTTPRANFASVKLPSGALMVTGGDSDGTTTALSTTETYDASAKTWTSAPSMTVARHNHSAVVLGNGSVLVAGGGTCAFCDNGAPQTFLSTAELFDGTSWTATGAMTSARAQAATVIMSNGSVFTAGGDVGPSDQIGSTGETYNPTTAKWTAATNSMSTYRAAGGAVALSSGRVLVVGGYTYDAAPTTTDYFDPSTNSFSTGPALLEGRVWPNVGLLDDGSVIIAGGASDWNPDGQTAVMNVDILSPTTEAWTTVARPSSNHIEGASAVFPTASGTPSSQFLLVGGYAVTGTDPNPGPPVAAAEMFDRTTGAWTSFGVLTVPRWGLGVFVIDPSNAVAFGGITGQNYIPAGDSNTYPTTGASETTGTAIDTTNKCTDNGNCTSGFCVDGYCCNAACTGTCQACDVVGQQGNCVAVNGAPHVAHGTCADAGLECASTCDGVHTTCTTGVATTPCGVTSCAGNTLSGSGTCSGDSTNACNPGPSAPCAGALICDTATACKTSCASNLDCVSGDVCTLSTGICAPPAPDAGVNDAATSETGQSDAAADNGDTGVASTVTPPTGTPEVTQPFEACAKDTDCPSGHCVDGVCCNTACADRCHSCALLASPGTCTLEPIGTDLRNDCGPSLQCLGTCDGTGQCIGAGPGSTCARNRCTTSSKGIGAAYCASAGSACNVDAVIAFDCAPYACEPAFGACATSCGTTDDCADGFVCDATTKSCVVSPTSSGKSGGCAIAEGIPRDEGCGAWAALLIGCVLAGGAARRSRRGLAVRRS